MRLALPRFSASMITKSSIYGIETVDYTLAPSAWKQVTLCDAPDSEYFLRDCPADAIIRYTDATLVKEENGVRIYDAGENASGRYPMMQYFLYHSKFSG
jgi:hypothetical protein